MNTYYSVLSSDKVSLEPLSISHIDELKTVCKDPEIWRWFTIDLTKGDDLEKWMKGLVEESERGVKMTYAIRLLETGQIIGSTSYGNIDGQEKVIEIGWTWIGSEFMGSGINKHMKFVMLNHAFETIGIERLELRTDEINVRSRRAMEKIGAKYDGTLRSQRFTRGGRRRNTVVYSILREEWLELKKTIFKEF